MTDILEYDESNEYNDTKIGAIQFQEITATEYFKRGQQMRAKLKTKFAPRKRSFWKKITSFFY